MTITEALQKVEKMKTILQVKKRKVLISIGATDLKTDKPLHELTRDFTKLFLLCDELKLKPLITTVLCFDNPIIKEKADIFNKFLLKCFQNVIDLRKAAQEGFSQVINNLKNT